MMGDQNDRNAFFLIQLGNRLHDFPAASGIQHGSRFIQHDTLGLHSNDACNGDTLLLTAGKQMGRVFTEFVHSNLLQRIIHSLANGRTGNTQILRAKGHILLYHVGNDLVIRILEDHTDGASNTNELVFVGSIHAEHIGLAPGGQ